MKIAKSQIDRLGERLKEGKITETDLRLLDQYRRSFAEAYTVVLDALQNQLALAPTSRPAKSTSSIVEKLRRESIRLTQIQDIAGCRIIAANIARQEQIVQSIRALFADAVIVDRRQRPSHGYRAVHIIVKSAGKMVEIQLRTALQHLWAEVSEKFSDVVDFSIKYGGGDETTREVLAVTSQAVAGIEDLEKMLIIVLAKNQHQELPEELSAILKEFSNGRQKMDQMLRDLLKAVNEIWGQA